MDQVEQKFLATKINQPLILLRYIYDIFFIWTDGEKGLEKFMSSFNSFTPNLMFTYESSKKDISFFHLKISLSKDKLSTDLRIKHNDCHQYSSGHPKHTKQSIVYSQLLRVSRICSRENDFNRHKSNIKIWFQKRRYLENINENEMKKVKFPSFNKVQRKKSKGILFVVTYHPLLKQLEGILRRNKYLLNMNAEIKQTFTAVPMVSCRSCLPVVVNNMLEKPLGSLGLGGTTINVMIGNILGMRIVSKNIYLDIFIVGNIQFSLKMSR